jgi:hypothetical protein
MRATFIPDIARPLLPLHRLTHHFLSISSVSSSRSPFCAAHTVHNKLLLSINNCDPVHSSRSPGHFFHAGAIPGVAAMASVFRPETARQPPVERPPTPPNGGRVSYLSLFLCSSNSSKKRIWNSRRETVCRFMTMDVCIFFQGGRCVCNLLPKEEALECRLLLECMYSRVVLFKVLLGDSTLRRYDEESSDPLRIS